MEWQQIRGFYHLARLGSFTRAAEATFRTQSALSQQIKKIEETLGCRLVERIGKRKIRLTAAGEKFFKFSEQMLRKFEAITEEIDELSGHGKGRIRIAAPYTTLYHLFPSAVQNFIKCFPNVELTILDRSQETVLSLVKEGDIDFGFVLESNVSTDFSSIRWRKVQNVVLTPMNHPLAKKKKLSLREISAYPLILPPKGNKLSFRQVVENRLKKLNCEYKVIMESSNVELSALYTEIGLGISFAAIVPDLPALKNRRLAFLNADHLFPPDRIAVVLRKDIVLSSFKKAFIDTLLGKSSRWQV